VGSAVTVALGPFEDLIAAGLTQIIDEDAALELVATADEPRALHALLAERQPTIALINYMSSADLRVLEALHRRHPDTRVIVLTEHPTAEECDELLALGAAGCIRKDADGQDVLATIHLASRGMRVAPIIESASRVGEDAMYLTPREVEVLRLLQEGRSNAQIAHALSVSVETVRSHARRIYKKLGVSSRRALAPGRPGLRAVTRE